MIKRKLSHEILGLLAAVAGVSVILYVLLRLCGTAIVMSVTEAQNLILSETELFLADAWVRNLSLLVSVLFFVLLFLFLLGERLSYIREILEGIDALRQGRQDYRIPVEGSSELAGLAAAVNRLSETQQQVREKEQALQEEKEQLIRALSHDIRTPLTTILSCSELLMEQEYDPEQRCAQLALIRKKAEQIRELTEVLLGGGQRNPVHYEDTRLLMEQLAEEFSETVEDTFALELDLTDCGTFAGALDVQELRRIFDNLASNICKYADPAAPVALRIAASETRLVISQENAVRRDLESVESYQVGIRSIRRIALHYGGQVEIEQEADRFVIVITLQSGGENL